MRQQMRGKIEGMSRYGLYTTNKKETASEGGGNPAPQQHHRPPKKEGGKLTRATGLVLESCWCTGWKSAWRKERWKAPQAANPYNQKGTVAGKEIRSPEKKKAGETKNETPDPNSRNLYS